MRTNKYQNLDGSGIKIGIVAARFNQKMTDGLLLGCLKALRETGVSEGDITVLRVPGSFEIPHGARLLLKKEEFDVIITLGMIIKGETKHNEVIAHAVARGIEELNIGQDVPILFGVVTAENTDQARARSNDDEHNRGRDAALAAIEMASIT